jgi:hypothetical protein
VKGDLMPVKITITRENGEVRFERVTVPDDENVFFVNLDTEQPHHPSLLPGPLGKAPPSPPSDEVVPHSPYFCLLHAGEQGIIDIVPGTDLDEDECTNTTDEPIYRHK